MTSMKTVLLGSAAAIVATGAAQAADLPVKKAAAAVQYVEVCPVYGAGFYKLPGTDICVKHFGSVKFGIGFQDARRAVFVEDDDGVSVTNITPDASNTSGWQWSVRPGWDFRSPTSLGTLRTVVQLRSDQRAGIYESEEPNLQGAQRTNNLVHRGYIEWAGFTIGKAGTNFTYWDQDDVISAIGGESKESIPMMITYTMEVPGGIKATLGLESTGQWTEGYVNVSAPDDDEGPFRTADVVASLSVEQPWGSAKVAGLLHFQAVNDGITHEIEPAFAILGGITFKLPTLGDGDQLLIQGNYCDGVNHGCGGSGGGAANSPTSFERPGQYLEGLQRTDVDAYLTGTASGGWAFHNVEYAGVLSQFRHYWSPLLRSNVHGSYQKITTPAVAKSMEWFLGGRGDAKVWDIGANLIWGRSRRTVEIGIEALYKSVKQDLPAGTTGIGPHVDTNPSGWTVNAFIQRAW